MDFVTAASVPRTNTGRNRDADGQVQGMEPELACFDLGAAPFDLWFQEREAQYVKTDALCEMYLVS